MANITTADRIAMYVGGGLLVVAIPIMGLINVLAGYESPMYVYELTQGGSTTTGYAITPGTVPQGAELIHSPLIAPNIRAYLIAFAFIIFGLYAIYRLFVHRAGEEAVSHVATPSSD